MAEQGAYALHALRKDGGEGLRLLLESGHLARDEAGTLSLAPAGLMALEDRMLLELFSRHPSASFGMHDATGQGAGAIPKDEACPWQPGEPLGPIDLSATLGEAARRMATRPSRAFRDSRVESWGFLLREDDLRIRDAEAGGRCAVVLLLDLSGSMARHGKFPAARRAVLALRALVRRRFPGDEIHAAGFATRAERLDGKALATALPRSVGLFDPHDGPLRVALDDPAAPAHFTNIQAGLRLARRLLRGKAHAARQVLLVTDGEPTACLDGDGLVLAYPPTTEILESTLAEARRCAAERIALGVFGLVGEYADPGLGPFVARLAKAGRGESVLVGARQLAPAMVQKLRLMRNARG